MDFPQYRKRFDNKSYYRIVNDRSFEEVQLIGDKVFIHKITAEKYFEILRIQEMLEASDGLYIDCSPTEYDVVKSRNQ